MQKLDLKKGDVIKITKGSGPFVLLNSGEKECIGYFGKYKIIEVKHDGVIAGKYPNFNGFCFIYLGSDKIGITGAVMTAHRITKLEKLGKSGKLDDKSGKEKNRRKQKEVRKNSS